MAGVLGQINNNLIGLQQLAQGRQELEQRNKLIEDERLATDYLRKFQTSSQEGNPDYASLNEAIIRSPQLSKNVLDGIGIREKRQGQDAASFISQAASVANDPNRFMQLAQARVNYLQQNGRDPSDTIQLIETYQANPGQAMKDLQGVGAALANQGYLDKDIYSNLFGIQKEITPYQQAQLDLDKERLAIAREGNQMQRSSIGQGTANQKDWDTYQRLVKENHPDARQFGIGAGFVSAEGQKLSDYVTKQIDLASSEASQADMDSGRYKTLASQLRQSGASGGIRSTIGEYIKEQSGGQDDLTSLRRNVLQIVNSEAIKNLPPGVATEKDIELARQPFPTDKSSPEYVANWLEAVSNLNAKKAEYATFKADFLAKNGTFRDSDKKSLLSAWRESQKNEGGSGKGGATPGIAGATTSAKLTYDPATGTFK